MRKSRENFGSSMAAVLAMAGSAIGLGNIWRFPYMAGQNGGAAFIIIYLCCVVVIALPILLAESMIGRRTQANTFGAMELLAPGTRWKWMGFLTVFSPLIILSFYSVVGGWSVGYFFKSVFTGLGTDSAAEFVGFTSSTVAPLICHTVFLMLTALIVVAGVKSGIEKFNDISLPLLFTLIVAVAAYSLTLPGARAGVRYLVRPDFHNISARTVADAMGQAFFSLSLGVGTILTYSSYMKKDADILSSGAGTAAFDMIFAIIAGFAVMPAVFAAGIEPGAGPGLIFESLPFIFVKMGIDAPVLSRIVSVLFFLTIAIAALTSSISMFEVGTAYLVEEKGFSRRKAVAVIFAGTWTLGALCSLSFGPFAGVRILGHTIFGFCDVLTSNVLMTFGALLFVLFVGWKMDKSDVMDEFTDGGRSRIGARMFGTVYFLIRYIAPLAILAIFATSNIQ